MLVQTSGSVEYPSFIKILNTSILMVPGNKQNCPSISLTFSVLQVLNFIDFGTWTLLVNEVHSASFE